MKYTTLVSIDTLAKKYADPNWVIVDCHFLLDDPDAGRRAFQRAHIPGARYAHLDQDLSGPIIPGTTGRHPLPVIDVFAASLSSWGIDNGTQVVAYDNRGGGIAARLWWMLKWLGHSKTAVLDGSFHHWKQAGHPVTDQPNQIIPKQFIVKPRPALIADITEVETIQQHPEKLLIDSRSPERFRGETEPLDAKAGHIPGAVNRFFMHNLDESGKMLSASELRYLFKSLVGETPTEDVIFYCGWELPRRIIFSQWNLPV